MLWERVGAGDGCNSSPQLLSMLQEPFYCQKTHHCVSSLRAAEGTAFPSCFMSVASAIASSIAALRRYSMLACHRPGALRELLCVLRLSVLPAVAGPNDGTAAIWTIWNVETRRAPLMSHGSLIVASAAQLLQAPPRWLSFHFEKYIF